VLEERNGDHDPVDDDGDDEDNNHANLSSKNYYALFKPILSVKSKEEKQQPHHQENEADAGHYPLSPD
jgi:hypothetical protein